MNLLEAGMEVVLLLAGDCGALAEVSEGERGDGECGCAGCWSQIWFVQHPAPAMHACYYYSRDSACTVNPDSWAVDHPGTCEGMNDDLLCLDWEDLSDILNANEEKARATIDPTKPASSKKVDALRNACLDAAAEAAFKSPVFSSDRSVLD